MEVETEGTSIFPQATQERAFLQQIKFCARTGHKPQQKSLSNTDGRPGKNACRSHGSNGMVPMEAWEEYHGNARGVRNHFKCLARPRESKCYLTTVLIEENLLYVLSPLLSPSLLPIPWARKEYWRRRRRRKDYVAPPTSRGGEKLKAALRESLGGLVAGALHSHGRGPGSIPLGVELIKKNGRKRSGYWFLQEAGLFSFFFNLYALVGSHWTGHTLKSLTTKPPGSSTEIGALLITNSGGNCRTSICMMFKSLGAGNSLVVQWWGPLPPAGGKGSTVGQGSFSMPRGTTKFLKDVTWAIETAHWESLRG